MGDDEYKTTMIVGIGPVRGKYNAKIMMRDKIPYSSFRLVIEGNGPTGFVNAEASITLEEKDGRTTVSVDSDAQVGGTVARVGQRLLESVGRMTMGKFFGCLHETAK